MINVNIRVNPEGLDSRYVFERNGETYVSYHLAGDCKSARLRKPVDGRGNSFGRARVVVSGLRGRLNSADNTVKLLAGVPRAKQETREDAA